MSQGKKYSKQQTLESLEGLFNSPDSLDAKIKELEENLKKAIDNDGMGAPQVWKLTKEFANLCNQMAGKLLKRNFLSKAETYLLKALQSTEPTSSLSKWEIKLDWQLLRYSIVQNLHILYQNQNKQETKIFEIYANLVKNVHLENYLQRMASALSGIDNLYITITKMSFKRQLYPETINYANSLISFYKQFFLNQRVLNEIMGDKGKKETEVIKAKKSMNLALAYYFSAKAKVHLGEENMALEFFKRAHDISRETFGEEDPTTLKYLNRYEQLLQKIEFLKNLDQSMDIEDIFSPQPKTVGKKKSKDQIEEEEKLNHRKKVLKAFLIKDLKKITHINGNRKHNQELINHLVYEPEQKIDDMSPLDLDRKKSPQEKEIKFNLEPRDSEKRFNKNRGNSSRPKSGIGSYSTVNSNSKYLKERRNAPTLGNEFYSDYSSLKGIRTSMKTFDGTASTMTGGSILKVNNLFVFGVQPDSSTHSKSKSQTNFDPLLSQSKYFKRSAGLASQIPVASSDMIKNKAAFKIRRAKGDSNRQFFSAIAGNTSSSQIFIRTPSKGAEAIGLNLDFSESQENYLNSLLLSRPQGKSQAIKAIQKSGIKVETEGEKVVPNLAKELEIKLSNSNVDKKSDIKIPVANQAKKASLRRTSTTTYDNIIDLNFKKDDSPVNETSFKLNSNEGPSQGVPVDKKQKFVLMRKSSLNPNMLSPNSKNNISKSLMRKGSKGPESNDYFSDGRDFVKKKKNNESEQPDQMMNIEFFGDKKIFSEHPEIHEKDEESVSLIKNSIEREADDLSEKSTSFAGKMMTLDLKKVREDKAARIIQEKYKEWKKRKSTVKNKKASIAIDNLANLAIAAYVEKHKKRKPDENVSLTPRNNSKKEWGNFFVRKSTLERFNHMNPFETQFLKTQIIKPATIKQLFEQLKPNFIRFFPICPPYYELVFSFYSLEFSYEGEQPPFQFKLMLKDQMGTPLVLNLDSQEKFSFADNIGSAWPVIEKFLDFYFEDNKIDILWKSHLSQKSRNPDTNPMIKDASKYTNIDKSAVRNFFEKLNFMLFKAMTKIRKKNGLAWCLLKNYGIFQSNFKKNQETLLQHAIDRRRAKKNLICLIENEAGALLAHIGHQIIINNPDVREENLKYYNYFGNLQALQKEKKKTKRSVSIEYRYDEVKEKQLKNVNLLLENSKKPLLTAALSSPQADKKLEQPLLHQEIIGFPISIIEDDRRPTQNSLGLGLSPVTGPGGGGFKSPTLNIKLHHIVEDSIISLDENREEEKVNEAHEVQEVSMKEEAESEQPSSSSEEFGLGTWDEKKNILNQDSSIEKKTRGESVSPSLSKGTANYPSGRSKIGSIFLNNPSVNESMLPGGTVNTSVEDDPLRRVIMKTRKSIYLKASSMSPKKNIGAVKIQKEQVNSEIESPDENSYPSLKSFGRAQTSLKPQDLLLSPKQISTGRSSLSVHANLLVRTVEEIKSPLKKKEVGELSLFANTQNQPESNTGNLPGQHTTSLDKIFVEKLKLVSSSSQQGLDKMDTSNQNIIALRDSNQSMLINPQKSERTIKEDSLKQSSEIGGGEVAPKRESTNSTIRADDLKYLNDKVNSIGESGRKKLAEEIPQEVLAHFLPLGFTQKSYRESKEIPFDYTNPFHHLQIISVSLVKLSGMIFILTILFDFNEANELTFVKAEQKNLMIKINLSQKYPKGTYEIERDFRFQEFMDIFFHDFPRGGIDPRNFKSFLLMRGLTQRQLRYLRQICQNYFSILNNHLNFRDPRNLDTEAYPIEKKEIEVYNRPIVQYITYYKVFLKLQKINSPLLGDKIDKDFLNNTLFDLNSMLKIPKKRISFFAVNIIKRKRPKPNNSLPILITDKDIDTDIIKESPFSIGPDVKMLKFYNGIDNLSKQKYFLRIRTNHGPKYIRVIFYSDDEKANLRDKGSLKISYYDPLSLKNDYCLITDQKDIEKVKNVLKQETEQSIQKTFNMYLIWKSELVGKRLFFFRENRQSIMDLGKTLLSRSSMAGLKLTLLTRMQDEYLKIYFRRKTLFQVFNFHSMGYCYMTIHCYTINESYSSGISQEDEAFFLFEIRPFNSKTKLIKFIIHSQDFPQFFNSKLMYDNDRHLIQKLNLHLFSNMVYTKENLYRGLSVPVSRLTSRPELKNYNLRINIKKISYEEPNPKNFLDRFYNKYRVIFQRIHRVGNDYLVITVKKHNVFSYWGFSVYCPKSCRTYFCSISTHDLAQLSYNFLQKNFPYQINSIIDFINEHCTTKNINFQTFSQLYSKLEVGGLDQRPMKDSFSTMNKIKMNMAEREAVISAFIEIKFWEKILEQVSLELKQKKKLVLHLDNYTGILREFLYDEVIGLSDMKEEVFIEMFLETSANRFIEICEPLENLPFKLTDEYNIFVRMSSFNRNLTSNEKFSLRDIVFTYASSVSNKPAAEVVENLQNNHMTRQSDLKDLCFFIVDKLKKNNNMINLDKIKNPINFIDFESYKLLSDKSMLVNPDKTAPSKMKLNSNIDLEALIGSNIKRYVLIYRGVFTLKPLQMIAITFRKDKEKFYIFLYNNKNSGGYLKKIGIYEIERDIPYVKKLLELGLFINVGSRILKLMKNTLIIKSYFSLN